MIADISKHKSMRRIYDIIFFSFLATFIASLENMFPRPLPYFRIGFTFVILLLVLNIFSMKELILLVIIKNITVSLVFAYIFTPPFYLGLSGGIISVIMMKAFEKTKLLSLFGLSIIGAVSNNIVQLMLAKYLFSLPSIKILLPIIMIFSIISGSIVGIFSIFLNDTHTNNNK